MWFIGIQHWTSISAILHNFLLHGIVERYFFYERFGIIFYTFIADEYYVFWKIFEHTELFCMRHNRKLVTRHISQQWADWPLTQAISHKPLFSRRCTLYIIVICNSLFSIHCAYTESSLRFWIFCLLFLVCDTWICTGWYCVYFFLWSVDVISYTTGLYSLDSWFCCICFLNVFLALKAVFIFMLLNK